MKIILVDYQKNIVEAWASEFAGYADIDIRHGSVFKVDCDALVSPANSFGFMDGGLDKSISKFLGWHIQKRLQDTINVYLATRAVLLLIKYGVFEDGQEIAGKVKTVAFPGMGTGVGMVQPVICARQMKRAIDDVIVGKYTYPKT